MPNDQPEPLAAIIAEMRDLAKPRRVGGDLCINIACPATISIWADRIEAAAEREREINQKILAAANDANAILKDDRDRAIRFANAAPHPGSASWKEMQSDARKVATLRDALVEILDRTNREKARDYDAALNGGILEIHDIANTALNETKGE